MNSRRILPVLAMLCFVGACSKNNSSNDTTTTTDPGTDSSQCLLSAVSYPFVTNIPAYWDSPDLPLYWDSFTLEYDTLKRVRQRTQSDYYDLYSYETGKVIQTSFSKPDSSLKQQYIYTFDNKGLLLYNRYASYYKATSINDYLRLDSTVYQYDADGYLTGQKTYVTYMKSSNAPFPLLKQERKFTYQGGNMVQRENIYYNGSDVTGGGRLAADTITYTYDNTPLFTEGYLYYVRDFSPFNIGKQNKNNVTGMQLKLYDINFGAYDLYKSIQYTYVAGKRLDKVTMAATTVKGASINTAFGFTYKCN